MDRLVFTVYVNSKNVGVFACMQALGPRGGGARLRCYCFIGFLFDLGFGFACYPGFFNPVVVFAFGRWLHCGQHFGGLLSCLYVCLQTCLYAVNGQYLHGVALY